jgi:S1-C subfamily serine protease
VSDQPEEPADGEPVPHDGAADDADPDAPLRGWIDPDDRLWRHPSELGAGPGAQDDPPTGPVTLSPPQRHPFRNVAMILIGVAALVAVVAWIVVLLSPASQHPLSSATKDTGPAEPTTLAGAQNAVPAVAETAGRSMVQLVATTTHGTVTLIGVAVAEGGLVVTTADLLGGLQHLDMVGPGGKLEEATLTASDPGSDVALVTVPEDVPVAPFADDTLLSGGAPDLLLSYGSAGGSALALHCTPGSVATVGTPIANGPANGMAAIVSSAPVAPTDGQPLLNQLGQVVGILYDPAGLSRIGNGAALSTFLPTQLVVGVADDLRSRARVVHGWIGVGGTDLANGGGAKVVTVDASGPAAGHLQSGQVIVAVDSQPVRTMAELRARLYVLPPGAPVTISVQGPTGTHVVSVTLSASS